MQVRRVTPNLSEAWLIAEHARRKTIIVGGRRSMELGNAKTHPNDRNYLGQPLCRLRAGYA